MPKTNFKKLNYFNYLFVIEKKMNIKNVKYLDKIQMDRHLIYLRKILFLITELGLKEMIFKIDRETNPKPSH